MDEPQKHYLRLRETRFEAQNDRDRSQASGYQAIRLWGGVFTKQALGGRTLSDETIPHFDYGSVPCLV